MKRLRISLLSLTICIVCSQSVAKPFHRVLVLSGGGMQTATFLGVIDGLQKSGWNPDLIITTCGASISAAILNAEGGIDQAQNYIFSDDFKRLVRSAQLKRKFALPILLNIYNNDLVGSIPQIFKNSVMEIPQHLSSKIKNRHLEQPFSKALGVIPVLMVSAQLKYGPQDVGQAILGRKLYQEVLFTDSVTASQVVDYVETPIAVDFPESYVAPEILKITDIDLFSAARASIADPYEMTPMKINDDYYLTGGINLFPIELAQSLGDEVIATYDQPYEEVDSRAIKNIFGYDANKRLKKALNSEITHWIDMSDDYEFENKYGFDPQLVYFWIEKSIPEENAEFDHYLSRQWAYGRARAQEAVLTPPNSRAHIRQRSF